MGPRIERLKTRPEFLRVAATRKKWAAPGLILQVKSHPADGQSTPTDGFLRVGFTVSRKVGNSVARNRAKRRLRALAADVLPRCSLGPDQSGFDLVIIGRRTTLTRPYIKLAEDLLKALRKVGIAVHSAESDMPKQNVPQPSAAQHKDAL